MPANPALPVLPVAEPPSPAPKVNVLVVVGTRPEAIKLLPIILALRDSESIQAGGRDDGAARPDGARGLRDGRAFGRT